MAGDGATSSSNAITLPSQKYEVFLSFSGMDARKGFLSHLYAALDGRGIKTYIDDKSLERGNEISNLLAQAIRESEASIILFSENYASSWWCLDELVQILQCRERNGQIVVPVFYGVEPTHVRKQEGAFGEAFSRLKQRFKKKEEMVNTWRTALSKAADLSGWDSSVIRSEAEMLDRIVKDVIGKLARKSRPSNVVKGLVGIEKRIKEIKSLLCINNQDVRTIGIWGMGGIGKTTLAKQVFSRFSFEFEGCCFLENIREEWEKGKMTYLRDILSSVLLHEENPYNVKKRLSEKNVLIVLDDVSDLKQLKFLVGDCSQFGCGSRIIVTTRDKQMLRYLDADDAIYKVEALDHNEALELFLLNAFKSKTPTSADIELSEKVLNYAQGIPLALTVLGSTFRCKKKENWEKVMDKIKAPNDEIQNVLKVSYDGLDGENKRIFLDIACFFKGKRRDYVEEILDACGFSAKTGIDDLVDRFLVFTDHDNVLQMHDLIQEMGWEIENSAKERSRLWNPQEVFHVLKNDMGSQEIEGIFLDTSKIGELALSPLVFKQMPNLRLLKIDDWYRHKLHFPRGLQYLPDKLRYLNWSSYPLKSLPSSFTPSKLVKLVMRGCQLKHLWSGVQDLANLKHIDLAYSKNLTQIPDLSLASKLEYVDLQKCTSLVQLPPLKFATLEEHTSKIHLVSRFSFNNPPGTLWLDGCSGLKSLPNVSGYVERLDLSGTAVGELPMSFMSLGNLSKLFLVNSNLKHLPSSICLLEGLSLIDLSYSSSFNKFPLELPRYLEWLNLSETAIEQVPSSIEHLSNTLKVLFLRSCKRLKSLPSNLCKLKSLESLYLNGCSKLEEFPEILEPMEHLHTLDLKETGISELPLSFHNLVGRWTLFLDSCETLQFLQAIIPPNCLSLGYCHLLQNVNLQASNIIDTLPSSIKELPILCELHVSNCKNLRSLPELPVSLMLLDASGCMSLETVATSQTALIQAPGHRANSRRQFVFFKCFKLDKNSCNNIMIDFQIRILRVAIMRPPFNHEVSNCCPGNEIPKWIIYQSEKSSITIKLPPNWYTNSIGFILAVTARTITGCGYYFKTSKNHQNPEFHCEYDKYWIHSIKHVPDFNTDHVFMWYTYKDYCGFHDAVEVTFDFYLYPENIHDNIRRCGIRPLYVQDAEEFGIDKNLNVFREPDDFI